MKGEIILYLLGVRFFWDKLMPFKNVKIKQNMFYFIYYTLLVGLYVFWENIHLYISIQLSFYVCSLFWLNFIDIKRKDFYWYLIHHLTTIGLILGANYYSYYDIIYFVLFLHDIADIFLHFAKSINYMKSVPQFIKYILFGMFVLSFFSTRIIYFIIFYIPSMWEKVVGPLEAALFLGLCLLGSIHIFWFYQILRMLYNIVILGEETTEDVRSDDEEED